MGKGSDDMTTDVPRLKPGQAYEAWGVEIGRSFTGYYVVCNGESRQEFKTRRAAVKRFKKLVEANR